MLTVRLVNFHHIGLGCLEAPFKFPCQGACPVPGLRAQGFSEILHAPHDF